MSIFQGTEDALHLRQSAARRLRRKANQAIGAPQEGTVALAKRHVRRDGGTNEENDGLSREKCDLTLENGGLTLETGG